MKKVLFFLFSLPDASFELRHRDVIFAHRQRRLRTKVNEMVTLQNQPAVDHDELPQMIWLTPEESEREFDQLARELVGMSGDEFIRKLKAGEFLDIPDDEEHRAFATLAVMSGVGR